MELFRRQTRNKKVFLPDFCDFWVRSCQILSILSNLFHFSGKSFYPKRADFQFSISNLTVWNFVGGWGKTFSPENFSNFFFFFLIFDFSTEGFSPDKSSKLSDLKMKTIQRAKIFSSRKRFSFPKKTVGNLKDFI